MQLEKEEGLRPTEDPFRTKIDAKLRWRVYLQLLSLSLLVMVGMRFDLSNLLSQPSSDISDVQTYFSGSLVDSSPVPHIVASNLRAEKQTEKIAGLSKLHPEDRIDMADTGSRLYNDISPVPQTIASIVRAGERANKLSRANVRPHTGSDQPSGITANPGTQVTNAPPRYKGRSKALRAADGVLQRVLGASIARGFVLKILDSSDEDADSSFAISSTAEPNVVVTLEGTTTLAITSALSYYMTHYMKASVSWTGNSVPTLPLCAEEASDAECYRLPEVPKSITRKRRVPVSYYMNTCTPSYTMWQWNWERWETEIDWMALKGINLPLAFTGQEYVWRRLYQRHYNMTDADLSEWFSGPAFLAWFRMGNLQKWGGALPDRWIDDQHRLQKRILQRMLSLGITPVLPAFAGHVPQALTRLVPSAKYSKVAPGWGGMNSTYVSTVFLDVNDKLYQELGRLFIEEQTALYGHVTDVYNADQYNELTPASLDLSYLRQAGEAQMASLKAGNPDAHWLMQGWTFGYDTGTWSADRVEAYLSGVKATDLTILDLYSETVPVWRRLKNYFGKPFIWNMLHNFGGTTDLKGMLNTILTLPANALQTAGELMVGVGVTPEGLNQNVVVYDALFDFVWRAEAAPKARQWLQTWVSARYSSDNAIAQRAWRLLHQTVYSCDPSLIACQTTRGHLASIIERQPYMGMYMSNYYDFSQLRLAWASLLEASERDRSLKNSVTYRSDVVNVGRQVLSDSFRSEYVGLMTTVNDQALSTAVKLQRMKVYTSAMHTLVLDLHDLLSTDRQTMLGPWIAEARNMGHGDADMVTLMDFNARNQVTMWGPDGGLQDYAAKLWAGLLLDYHWPRWESFIKHLVISIATRKPFDNAAYDIERRAHERYWQTQPNKYTTEPVGNPIQIGRDIYRKHY